MFAGRSRLDGVFAVGIVGTAVKRTEATALLDHFTFLTDGAGDAGCLCGGAFDKFAFRVGATRDERTEAPHLFDERAAAFGAWFANIFVFWDERAVFHARAFAVRESRAAIEGAVLAELQNHGAPAFGATQVFGGVAEIVYLVHFVFRLYVFGKRRVEILQCFLIVALAIRDIVEFLFHIGGECIAYNIGEVFFKKGADGFSGFGCVERAAVFGGVVAVEEGFDDRCIGAWSPDTALLELFDESRFGVAAWRFGLLLLGVNRADCECASRSELWHVHIVLLCEGINLEPAREKESRAVGDEIGNGSVGDIGNDFGAEHAGARHL